MIQIIRKSTSEVTQGERAEIGKVLAMRYTLNRPAESIVQEYCGKVKEVLLAYSDGDLAAFQFYQNLHLDKVGIHHFSLACKLPGMPSGIQERIGVQVLWNWFLSSKNIVSPMAVIGICNHPSSYRNMYRMGGACFPDVVNPEKTFRYKQLYADSTKLLGIASSDLSDGRLPNRLTALGLHTPAIEQHWHQDKISASFLKYIGNDLNT
nr:hypothetical protein [Nitrosomonas nitrosa]